MNANHNHPPGVIGRSNIQGKFMDTTAQPRRALGNLNQNVIGAAPLYPCAANKRSLSEMNSDKIPPHVPQHRPMTRKFAAQLAKKQQPEPKGTKDTAYNDKENNDLEVPMFVQHTEAMLEEIDRMEEELVLEDILGEQGMDIDTGDKNNPLAVAEYVDGLYHFYNQQECLGCVPADYMESQYDINERMRAILVDWLIEVHYKFELMDETLFLTVNLIDRFLSIHQIGRKKLQLVGVTAMLLACKYEEVSVPVVDDLILISDRAYTRKEVLDMEKLMVTTLQYKFSFPTPYVFMRRYLKAAQSDRKLELLSFFMVELCLVQYEMLEFPPSQLAAAAIYTAQCTLSRTETEWSKPCEFHSKYSAEQLRDCSRMIASFHMKAGTGKLTGAHRKYSTSKFGYAARTKPASFLLE